MKILELTNFSAGVCGVFQRVKQESILLSNKGHEVMIFSSNATKGNNEIAPSEDKLNKVKIKRFPFRKMGGESFMFWNFTSAALEFNPDVIIAHSYRHPHTVQAIKIAKKLRKQGKNCKVFLVTHAPFERTRSFVQTTIVSLYDFFIGRRTLKKFNKVLVITKWEYPYLQKLGLSESQIVYMPNGIPKEFFSKIPSNKESNKILFLGRLSPIKDLETLIRALALVKNKSITLEFVGPSEEGYLVKLKSLIAELKLEKRIIFTKPIFNIAEKIKKIDSSSIFILPSLSEGMPQSLIEAMARERLVIASSTLGAKDLIDDGFNGLLFEIGNEQQLAQKIELAFDKSSQKDNKKLRQMAKVTVKKFNWDFILEDINNLISS